MGQSLEVFLNQSHVGTVDEVDHLQFRFTYDRNYTGPSLSVSMPLGSNLVFSGKGVKNWFAGLLPDDDLQKTNLATKLNCSRRDIALLEKLGADVPGAIQVLNQGVSPAPIPKTPYRRISEEDIGIRLESLKEDEGAPWIEPGEKWSLGGTQTKIALAHIEGAWYASNGAAASTHIIKPGIGQFAHQAVIECATMRLGSACGIPTAPTRLYRFGETDAIVVDRYDRALRPDGVVMRFHQEDFCQAVGVAPEKKYATDGGPSPDTFIKVLKTNCAQNDLLNFCDYLLFNALTGSTDGHAKNYSLLHLNSGVRLAPQYDVATILPYMLGRKTYRTALSFGGENRIGWLRGTCFEKMERKTGIDADLLRDHAYNIGEGILNNINPIVDELKAVPGTTAVLDSLRHRMTSLVEGTLVNLNRAGHEMRHFQFVERSTPLNYWDEEERG